MDFLKEVIIKSKTKYIYPVLFLFTVLIFLTSCSSDEKSGYVKISKNKLPQDEVHKNLGAVNSAEPSKENVDKSVIDKINNLEKELASGSKDTSKMLEYADYMIAAHQTEKGIMYYKKILEIDSRRNDVLLQLAIAYSNIHKFNEALDVTNKILKNDPGNKIALYNLGALNATIGKPDKAKSIWENIIKKFPGSEMAVKAKQSLKLLQSM